MKATIGLLFLSDASRNILEWNRRSLYTTLQTGTCKRPTTGADEFHIMGFQIYVLRTLLAGRSFRVVPAIVPQPARMTSPMPGRPSNQRPFNLL